ncbi:MAG TPA: HlyD family secretion protein, partial [Myxococcaceae bacterium]|nr:HlyD family secretion protein [Myxococcaceae bacterium]
VDALRDRAKLRQALVTLSILLLAGAIVISITVGWNRWVGSHTWQTTDDAYLRRDVTPLSTKSAGIVARVATTDYQAVKAGDLLVQLRDDDFRAQVDLAQAAVSATRASLEELRTQKELQQSRIVEARANLAATAADAERTRKDRLREEEMIKAGATTTQKLEHAIADHDRFRATVTGRQAEIESQRKQLAVLDARQSQLEAEVRAREASLVVAQVNLDYTRIVAPTDGVLGERKVRAGQLVSAGTQVVSLVGPGVWVIANYKETQLAHVRVGNRAEVRVDGIPGVVWKGRVDTISPASGSQFSLLPPDNATGNFTKIAQRVPVKIVLDPEQALSDRLRSGMSVTASIKTER